MPRERKKESRSGARASELFGTEIEKKSLARGAFKFPRKKRERDARIVISDCWEDMMGLVDTFFRRFLDYLTYCGEDASGRWVKAVEEVNDWTRSFVAIHFAKGCNVARPYQK